jgi:hypothetical protein
MRHDRLSRRLRVAAVLAVLVTAATRSAGAQAHLRMLATRRVSPLPAPVLLEDAPHSSAHSSAALPRLAPEAMASPALRFRGLEPAIGRRIRLIGGLSRGRANAALGLRFYF